MPRRITISFHLSMFIILILFTYLHASFAAKFQRRIKRADDTVQGDLDYSRLSSGDPLLDDDNDDYSDPSNQTLFDQIVESDVTTTSQKNEQDSSVQTSNQTTTTTTTTTAPPAAPRKMDLGSNVSSTRAKFLFDYPVTPPGNQNSSIDPLVGSLTNNTDSNFSINLTATYQSGIPVQSGTNQTGTNTTTTQQSLSNDTTNSTNSLTNKENSTTSTTTATLTGNGQQEVAENSTKLSDASETSTESSTSYLPQLVEDKGAFKPAREYETDPPGNENTENASKNPISIDQLELPVSDIGEIAEPNKDSSTIQNPQSGTNTGKTVKIGDNSTANENISTIVFNPTNVSDFNGMFTMTGQGTNNTISVVPNQSALALTHEQIGVGNGSNLLGYGDAYSTPKSISVETTSEGTKTDDVDDGDTGDDANSNDLANELDKTMEGETRRLKELEHMLKSVKAKLGRIELLFNRGVKHLLGRHLLVTASRALKEIRHVILSFHNYQDSVRKDDGDENDGDYDDDEDDDGDGDGEKAIRYISSRHRLGHLIDILHHGFSYTHVKLSIKLKHNSHLKPHDLLFHFAHAIGLHTNILSARIAGPNEVFVGAPAKNFSVVVKCRSDAGCRWELDNRTIANVSNSSVSLLFYETQIGSRLLTYVWSDETRRIILASIRLSILANPNIKCFPLPRPLKDQWTKAGEMITPRADFTMTYLPSSPAILIVGGTADGQTPLASYEYFNFRTSCLNQSNMTHARMKHTATHLNQSDFVLIIGGQGSNLKPVAQTEFIWPFGQQVYKDIKGPRYSHATSPSMDSAIHIFGGLGLENKSYGFEAFDCLDQPVSSIRKRSVTPRFLAVEDSAVADLEGHTVTFVGRSPLNYIFGGRTPDGYNGLSYVSHGTHISELAYITKAASDTVYRPLFAHHQTTFIPAINSSLMTGGNDDDDVFSDSYLVWTDKPVLMPAGKMKQQRSYHAAVLLTNGSVLLIGGTGEVINGNPTKPLNSVERYDPLTEMFTEINPLKTARYGHRAIYVSNDTVIVCGGRGTNNIILRDCEMLMH